MLRTVEVRAALTAWGIYLFGMTAYCMVYQAVVIPKTPDLIGSLLVWLKEWGAWLFITPLVFKTLTRYESLERWPTAATHWAAVILFLSTLFPVGIDYLTGARDVTSSITIYLPRCALTLVIVYLVWRAFLRDKTATPPSRTYPETLLVSKGAAECLIQVERVNYLTAAGNYVEVYADGQLYLTRATMKQVEELLPPSQFVRVHRSHIVNIRDIELIKAHRSGAGTLCLKGGGTLSVSKKYRAELQKYRPQA